MAKQILLTPEGHKMLLKELDELKTVKRREVAEQLRQARAHGDLRENFAYDDAKRHQALIEGRIRDLQYVIERCKVVERPDGVTDYIHLGSEIELTNVESGEKASLTLVGVYEADPMQDKVSVLSPVGEALIGRGVGEIVDVVTPKGDIQYRIDSVR